jgi:CBS domain-containing protein
MNDQIRRVLEHKGPDVECTSVDTTVLDAVERMNAKRIGALVITDGRTAIGIFTERDVLARVISRGLDPRLTTVGEVMTRNPITVRADTTVAEAMMIVTQRRCRHLPVVDDTGLRGLISIGDLTSWMVRDQQQTIDDLHNYIRAA